MTILISDCITCSNMIFSALLSSKLKSNYPQLKKTVSGREWSDCPCTAWLHSMSSWSQHTLPCNETLLSR